MYVNGGMHSLSLWRRSRWPPRLTISIKNCSEQYQKYINEQLQKNSIFFQTLLSIFARKGELEKINIARGKRHYTTTANKYHNEFRFYVQEVEEGEYV